MTMTAPATLKLRPPIDDTVRASVEDLIAARHAGEAARREGQGPGITATLDALIGEDSDTTAHRTRDLLDAYRRGWRSAAPVRPAAPKHRAEIAAPVIEDATEPAEETGRNLMPIVVLLALAAVPTAALIGAASFLP